MRIELIVTVVHADDVSDSPRTVVGDFRSFDELPDAESWMSAELMPRLTADGVAIPGDKVLAKVVSCEGIPDTVPCFYMFLGLDGADIARLDPDAPTNLLVFDRDALRAEADRLNAVSTDLGRAIGVLSDVFRGLE